MPATIRTTLEDNSKAWADNLKKQFAAAGVSADQVGDKIEAIGNELDSRKAAELRKEVMSLADQIQRAERNAAELEAEFRGVGEAAKTASGTVRKLANDAGDLNSGAVKGESSIAGIVKAGVGLFAVKEVIGAISQGLSSLAAGGSKSAQTLIESFGKVGESLVSISNDPIFSSWITGTAGLIQDKLVPAITQIPSRIRGVGDVLPNIIARTGEWFKIFQDGTADTLRGQQKLRESLIATQKKQEEIDAFRAVANKELAGIMENAKQAREEAMLVQNQDILAIENAVYKARKEFESFRDSGVAATQANVDELKKLADRWQRLYDTLLTTRAEKTRKNEEDGAEFVKKMAEEKAAAEKKAIEEVTEFEKQSLEFRAAVYRAKFEQKMALIEEEKAAEKRKFDQAQALAKAQFDKAVQSRIESVKQIAGGIGPRQVMEQIQQQRAQQAREQFRADNQADIVQAKREGKDSQLFKSLLRKQEEAARLAGLRGRREFTQGRIGEDEVLRAQQQLVNRVAEQGVQSGKLSRFQADAIKEAAGVLKKQHEENRQIQRELEDTRSTLRQLMRDGLNSSRKAQGVGQR